MADNMGLIGNTNNRAVGRNVQLGFAAVIILVLISAGVSYYNTRQVYEHSTLLTKSRETQESLIEVFSTVKDAETGIRGYLIVGQKDFLDPYFNAVAQIQSNMDRLRELVADNPEQLANVESLQKKIDVRLTFARRSKTLFEEKGFPATREIIATGQGKRAMDEVRALVQQMRAMEEQSLVVRERQAAQSYFIATVANVVVLFLVTVLVGVAFEIVRRELRAHRRTMHALHEQREWLRVTLTSIGDAVIVTDKEGVVRFLNPVAGTLTGWHQDAIGHPLTEVFRIIDEPTRQPSESPVDKVLREGTVVGLANHTLLIARDGKEIAIDDSGAPIRDHHGRIDGVVLVFRDITERKRAEDALRQSEQELSDFFENATVGLHWVGPDGIILLANAAELELLGYSREEYVGRSIADFHVDADAIAEILQRLQAGEVVNDYEARLRCKDGSIRYVLINSSALWSEGKFVHTRCFTRDITARKRAEEALRRSELRYRRLFETSRNALLILDGDTGSVIDANPFVTELTGFTRPELTGKQLWQLGLFEDSNSNYISLAQMREQGVVSYDQLSIKTKAGIAAEVECVAVSYEMDGKEFVQFSIHDITARVLAEEGLRAARDRFRSVVDHVIHGIVSFDESGAIESVNPAAVRLFGYESAEIVGRNVKLLLPEHYHGEHDTYLANYLQTGQANVIGTSREVVGLRKDGATFPMELAISTFPLGKRRLFTGIVQDITERKHMEAELRERVEQLRDADRRKNEFLAMLAHELRNPLAPVQNAVHLLRKSCPTDPETTWAHDVIERQVQHMTRMVDDLLDVSRITRGMIKLQKEPLDIATVVARAVEMTQPLIDARKHKLVISVPPQPLRLEGDSPRLAQVLANLLNNAAKYTEDGGTIWVTAQREGDDVVVKVRDTGIGIPAEYLPRVFDLFSQEDSSLARTHGGLGIGLTLVRVLVRMHGGTVEAFSEGAGKGSEFVMRLPAVTTEEAQPQTTPVEIAAVAPAPRRILVVDDNIDGAKSLSMLLRQDGHEVQTAHDGPTALELARKAPLDVVLLDIGMPHMSGLEVARRMRGELGLTDVLLVAMTGYGQDEDRHRSQDAGFNAHMIKPLDLDALQTLLARS